MTDLPQKLRGLAEKEREKTFYMTEIGTIAYQIGVSNGLRIAAIVVEREQNK